MAAVGGLFQTMSGFARVSVEVNEPTSAPPGPVKVNVPPVVGIAPVAREAKYAPLIPSCEASVRLSEFGPVSLGTPASRPSILGTEAAPKVVVQLPGETGLLGV